jgi:hypothetical protein
MTATTVFTSEKVDTSTAITTKIKSQVLRGGTNPWVGKAKHEFINTNAPDLSLSQILMIAKIGRLIGEKNNNISIHRTKVIVPSLFSKK